jgi:hypothetical protein
MKKIEQLASPPSFSDKITEEDLEREIGNIPLRRNGGKKTKRKIRKNKNKKL